MKKKFKLGKTVMAAAVATSVFAVSNPADASNLSVADKAVDKAEKLAGALKWEVSVEYRKTKYPNQLVGYPNMKLHNDTKAALAAAKKAVSKLKGNDKEIYQAKLDGVTTYVNRSVAYIDAVSSGLKIQKKYNELKAKYDQGEVDDQTEKLYHELSREIKKNAFMLDRVYGVTTRAEFRDFYKHTAENQLKDLLYPVSIKMQIDKAEKALAANKGQEAASFLGNVEFLVKEAAVKGQKEDSKVIQGSLANLEQVQNEFNKTSVLYVADSTDAAAPSVFGPATGSETVKKTVYLFAGNNEHIKLQNLSVEGNVVVLGSPSGAGTVYLQNVQVKKVDAVGGSIIVENIADHSLHMNGVEAESLVVNDTDGSNIVAEDGVKVKDLVVSEKAGAKGTVSLESKKKGSFGTITVASKGSANSQGVALKGDLSDTTVTVTGEGSKLSVEKGATVKEINIKAASNIKVAEGSTVKEVKKDPSVKGDVSVDNKGTVEKAPEDVKVDGNKPVVVVPSTPNPNPNPTQPPAQSAINIEKVYILASDNNARDAKSGTVDLDGVSNTVKFNGLKIVGAPANSKINVTKIVVGGNDFIKQTITVDLPASNEVKVGDFLLPLDQSNDGVSLGNLRALAVNKDVIIKGNVSSAGYSSYDFTVSINLGNGLDGENLPTTLENSYFKVSKDQDPSTHVATVKIKNGEATIGDLTNDGINFTSILAGFVTTNIDAQGGNGSTAAEIKAKLEALTNAAIESIQLKVLIGRTVSYGNYTIKFE